MLAPRVVDPGRLPKAPAFSKLLVWTDKNGDRRSTPDELVSLGSLGIASIDLDYVVDPRCNDRGDGEVERASFRYVDASGATRTGAIVDVHLPARR